MASKGVSIGVEITGSAKGFKAASEDAQKATEKLREKANSSSKQIEQSFKQVAIATAKITAAVIVAQKAFELYKRVMDSSSGSADKFEETMSAAKFTVDAFFNALATNKLDNLSKKLKDAADAGKEYAAAMDTIAEATLGLSLEKALGKPDQTLRELSFRDRSQDPITRQKALNEYKAEALRIAKEEYELAKLAVIAEQDKIKGLGGEATLLQALYTKYNSNIETIVSAGDKLARISEIEETLVNRLGFKAVERLKQTKSGQPFLASKMTDEAKRLIKEWEVIKDGLTTDEKNFITLVAENNKVKESNVVAYIQALIKEAEAYSGLNEVGLENIRIENQINAEIESDKKDTAAEKLKKQKDAADELAASLEKLKKALGEIEKANLNLFNKNFNRLQNNNGIIGGGLARGGNNLAQGPNGPSAPSDELETINSLTRGILEQQEAVNLLASSFQSLFEENGDGFQGMIDTFIQGINRLLAEMAAKAALFLLLDVITGGGAGTFASFMGITKSIPKVSLASAGNINNSVDFRIDGTQLVGVLKNQSRKTNSYN